MSTDNAISHPAAGDAAKPTRQRIVLAAILLVTIFVAYFDRSNMAVLVANDGFLSDMGIKGQPIKIGLLMTAFLLTYGISNVVLSPLGDYLGARKAMVISIFLWGISMAMGGLVGSFTAMIFTRIVLGIGEGMHYPMQSIFVKKWFPPHERGRANSVWLTGQSLASAAAMPFFAWLVFHMGWRPSFFICAVLGIIPIYLLWFHTTDSPREHKKINALELAYIEEGVAKDIQSGPDDPNATVWENAKVFIYNYRYWLVVFYNICHSTIFWGLASWIPSYLKTARGFSWEQMGWIASLPFVLSVVAKVAGGWATDRAGRNAPFCIVAMLGSALSIYFGVAAVNNNAAAVLISFGMGMTGIGIPAAWAMTQRLVPGKAISTASGTLNGIATGIGALSPTIIGFCIALSGGSYAGGLFFLVGTAVLGLAVATTLTLQKY